ncbi:MAG: 50S ribosomal protein L22 [candidate division KSB1 bacterium]|nr:50S ribosomal protein L22 [candidate division KSB1 bacterium]MDZ7294364.1 50S ribosomal protein L22 [candidate division KSB1 bacterium]MDZ7338208.1 50S ribosomal protein L22 [candidate division KSB1 bacterium]MDZ7384550.1 50S ribosomal protein L22 [candidate division KSB1 bacterium]MDZ7392847.1 50S ribosomal protein L22 [candidate division KSB1 bacterium]
MEARCIAKYLRTSPRKMRQVADLIRGRGVEEALNILHFSPKAASRPLEKALRSAVANLMNTDEGAKLAPQELFVKEVQVNAGFTLRRYRAGSMGRASRIRKRTCHVRIVVADTANQASA